MAKSNQLLVFVLLSSFLILSNAQQDKDYLKMIRRDPITKMKKWIICDTCKTAMKEANRRARGMREALKNQELTEEHYTNITKYMCQPYHDHGQWITTYDIVKKKKKMSLVHHDGFGKCSHECETIAYACEDVREHYEEELPEYLYAKMSTAKLQKKICKRFCKGYKKKPKMEDNWGDEEWQELAEDQRNMFRSFVMGELSKREQPKDEQQEYLQRYAEAYIDQQETEKQQKAAKRRYENKQRARKGLPPLPEEDEEEEGKADEEGEGQTNEETDANTEQESNAEDANTDKTDL